MFHHLVGDIYLSLASRWGIYFQPFEDDDQPKSGNSKWLGICDILNPRLICFRVYLLFKELQPHFTSVESCGGIWIGA